MLLPEVISNARVLTCGYDVDYTRLGTNVGVDSILGNSKTLLANLVNMRKRDNTENQPIVFVVHSLGGLVVKDMLQYAKVDDEHKSIYLCTKAICFMGTPHLGANEAETFGSIANQILKLSRYSSNHYPINVLKPSSEVLERITDSFERMTRDQRFSMTCFYETMGPPGLKDPVGSFQISLGTSLTKLDRIPTVSTVARP